MLLRESNYIHADIHPQNLFLSLSDGHAVLIDYDSGVVVDRPEDAPTTFGKQGEPDLAGAGGCAAAWDVGDCRTTSGGGSVYRHVVGGGGNSLLSFRPGTVFPYLHAADPCWQ